MIYRKFKAGVILNIDIFLCASFQKSTKLNEIINDSKIVVQWLSS